MKSDRDEKDGFHHFHQVDGWRLAETVYRLHHKHTEKEKQSQFSKQITALTKIRMHLPQSQHHLPGEVFFEFSELMPHHEGG